uniref:Uncharacterized protein n=1 Tax=Arundo donax TaxID=35708 RepID=A0A0A8XZL4_ARUDO
MLDGFRCLYMTPLLKSSTAA